MLQSEVHSGRCQLFSWQHRPSVVSQWLPWETTPRDSKLRCCFQKYVQKVCYPILKGGWNMHHSWEWGEFKFQLDLNIFYAVTLCNDVISRMKMVSDTTNDQRNLFQFVLFFSLMSHIELNESHTTGKSTSVFWNKSSVRPDRPRIPRVCLIIGRNGGKLWHMEADAQLLFQPNPPNR